MGNKADEDLKRLEKEGNTTKGNMGEGRLSIDALDKLMKRGKYAPKPKTDKKKKEPPVNKKDAALKSAMKALRDGPSSALGRTARAIATKTLVTDGMKAGRGERMAAQTHTMPDGTMMKGAKHGMKAGGPVKGKCKMDGVAVRGKTRAKQRSK